MRTSIARFVKDESGTTAIEYALIAAGISVAILAAVNALGGKLTGVFNTISSDLPGAAAGGKPLSLHAALQHEGDFAAASTNERCQTSLPRGQTPKGLVSGFCLAGHSRGRIQFAPFPRCSFSSRPAIAHPIAISLITCPLTVAKLQQKLRVSVVICCGQRGRLTLPPRLVGSAR